MIFLWMSLYVDFLLHFPLSLSPCLHFPHSISHPEYRNSNDNLCDPAMVKFQMVMEVTWQSERRQIHWVCKERVRILVLSYTNYPLHAVSVILLTFTVKRHKSYQLVSRYHESCLVWQCIESMWKTCSRPGWQRSLNISRGFQDIDH